MDLQRQHNYLQSIAIKHSKGFAKNIAKALQKT
jgi:hypothetical protein